MKTLAELSHALRQAKEQLALPVIEMSRNSGLTAVTIRGVLTGKNDPRLSTLMTLAEQLGLEVMLLPKAVAATIVAKPTAPAEVQSLVSAALARQRKQS
jgi:hypothetical protein